MQRLRLREERIQRGQGECWLSKDGKRLFHRTVEVEEVVTVTACVPRALGATALYCRFVCDDGELFTERLSYRGIRGACDLYEGALSFKEAGLLFYSFVAVGVHGRRYGMRGSGSDGIVFSTAEVGAHFQLTVSKFAYPPPQWLFGGIIYHVFVDRFARGGRIPCRSDAVLRADWEDGIPEYPAERGGPLENNEFFGGTLYGVAAHLDHLVSLGVNCIYLSPIFEAYSNHKYDTGDYCRIDPMFGGEDAFLRLLREAGARGMRVVLDGVFNHTGSDSLYFNKRGRYPTVGAYQSETSPYRSWYTFYDFPNRYECWWGIDTLPRLDPSVPSLRSFIAGEGGVVDRYARLGIGGLRLDVVDELTDDFVAEIKERLSSTAADAVLFGEVWEDASHKVAYGVRKRYYEGRELDGVMNYPLREGLISYFRYGEIGALRYALCEVLANMPRRVANGTMNLLGSHDTERILTALAGEAEAGQTMKSLAEARLTSPAYRRGRKLLILAYLALATLPGVPTVFYGDEAGLEGYRDPLNRRPYPWHRQDRVLLAAYREIGAMRRRESVYREGDFSLIALTAKLLIFSRREGARVLLTAINRGDRTVYLRFDTRVTPIYGGARSGASHALYPLCGLVLSPPCGCRLSVFSDDGVPIPLTM